MNTELESLASRLSLTTPEARELALRFGLECVMRVEHLLEEERVLACLRVLEIYVSGRSSTGALLAASEEAATLANRHQGSRSIDGCGHAAVSATYGVSNALQGNAVVAAQYCAYASVYASGGYAAVQGREAFEPEFTWQVQRLEALASVFPGGSGNVPAPSDA